MEIAVSNLPFQGLSIGKMENFPTDIGIEIFAECGNEYYWEHWLPQIMEGRTGRLSVHAPFQNLDLSNPEADFEEMRKTYLRTFALCRQYGARRCVCHPYEGVRPDNDTPEKLAAAKECSLKRVLQLNCDAQTYGVELLIENMPQKHGLLNQADFLQLFAPHQSLHFLIDTGHANLQAWDMPLAFEQLGERIREYHLNDNIGDMDSHLRVFEGTFDWDAFFAGYTRYTPNAGLVCEYNEGPVEKIMATVHRIREQITEQTQAQ